MVTGFRGCAHLVLLQLLEGQRHLESTLKVLAWSVGAAPDCVVASYAPAMASDCIIFANFGSSTSYRYIVHFDTANARGHVLGDGGRARQIHWH